MTELLVKLPDDLAQRAKNSGLLSDNAMQVVGRRFRQVETEVCRSVPKLTEARAAKAKPSPSAHAILAPWLLSA